MRPRTNTIRALPFDFKDLKSHLRIDHDLDDVYINGLAWAAIEHVEEATGRTFAPETYTLVLSAFPCDVIRLPYAPVTSVEDIQYFDANNEAATLSDFYMNLGTQKSTLMPIDTWPSTYERPDAVTVTYHAGGARLPHPVRQAVFFLVGAWNENREGEITGTISSELALGVNRILSHWRKRPYA